MLKFKYQQGWLREKRVINITGVEETMATLETVGGVLALGKLGQLALKFVPGLKKIWPLIKKGGEVLKKLGGVAKKVASYIPVFGKGIDKASKVGGGVWGVTKTVIGAPVKAVSEVGKLAWKGSIGLLKMPVTILKDIWNIPSWAMKVGGVVNQTAKTGANIGIDTIKYASSYPSAIIKSTRGMVGGLLGKVVSLPGIRHVLSATDKVIGSVDTVIGGQGKPSEWGEITYVKKIAGMFMEKLESTADFGFVDYLGSIRKRINSIINGGETGSEATVSDVSSATQSSPEPEATETKTSTDTDKKTT